MLKKLFKGDQYLERAERIGGTQTHLESEYLDDFKDLKDKIPSEA
jgi:hypothetical protein